MSDDPVRNLVQRRPGAESIRAAQQTEATRIADGIYMSSGTSNAYMLPAGEQRIVINTGLGFEALTHRRLFDAVHDAPTRFVITTQGHVDHVGGIAHFRDEGTQFVAQANLPRCQQDDADISERRQAQSHIWFSEVIDQALKVADEHPDVLVQDAPVADLSFDERLELRCGDVELELIATPGGETIDSCVVWWPARRVLFTGNLFGPLFPHFPNFNTIRGDRYRDPARYLESARAVLELEPEVLVTGHGDPIEGTALIRECVERLIGAVEHVMKATFDGMAAGRDIHALMAEIRLPSELYVGQGYGRVDWAVRTLWEQRMGWFKARDTSELYPASPSVATAELAKLAGTKKVLRRAEELLDGDPQGALRMVEAALGAEPDDARAWRLYRDVHERLLLQPDTQENFWLSGWLRSRREHASSRLDELAQGLDATPLAPDAVAKLFSEMGRRFVPGAAEGIDVTFQYVVSGPGGGEWFVRVQDGECHTERGRAPSPTCTIHVDGRDLIALNEGKLHPLKAALSKRIRVEGDRLSARLLDKLFERGELSAPEADANTIFVDDLAAPKLNVAQRAALAFTRMSKTTFTQDAVLGAASKQTGLRDFGPDDFRERLQLLLDDYEADRGLTHLSRAVLFADLVRYARNRLLIEDAYRRHPEIDEVEIERPLIVAGLPRSGTTHLLNLIAADSRLRSLPLWESYEPVPASGARQSATVTGDPRFKRCQRKWWGMQRIAPHLAAMHPMNPEHIHEECELMGADFAGYLFEWTSIVPRYRDHYLSSDQRPHYAYMRRVLKLLQWQRGPQRWVLKCPQHMEQLPVLQETFPDATFVVTHRDPLAVIQSTCTMLAYAQRMNRTRPDPTGLLDYWVARVERLLQACVRDRGTLPEGRSVDVLFHEFMADDMATLEAIYAHADLAITPRTRQEFSRYAENHRRGKHGRVVYDLRTQFGADIEPLRERFAFYAERFPVRVEVS